jgi:hypothetical protein
MQIEQIFRVFSDILAILVLLSGAFAIFYKNYIKEWIKAKFKSELQKENEDYKQKFLREIETYRALLLKEFEEYKLNIDLKRNLAIQYSNKKLEVYEKIVALIHPIIVDIISYSKLHNEIREPFPEFKINKLDEIRKVFRSLHPYQFYIEPLSVGLRLANLYGDLVKIFYEDNIAKDEFIEKVNLDFSYLNAIMTNDILGVENSQKYMTEENLNLLKMTNKG